jgi:hypothetical protein
MIKNRSVSPNIQSPDGGFAVVNPNTDLYGFDLSGTEYKVQELKEKVNALEYEKTGLRKESINIKKDLQ